MSNTFREAGYNTSEINTAKQRAVTATCKPKKDQPIQVPLCLPFINNRTNKKIKQLAKNYELPLNIIAKSGPKN